MDLSRIFSFNQYMYLRSLADPQIFAFYQIWEEKGDIYLFQHLNGPLDIFLIWIERNPF